MAALLSGISSMATRRLLADAVDAYARRSGVSVAFESVGGVEAARRVQAGEPFDIVALAADALVALESEGLTCAGSRTDFARSAVALAVRAGAALPDIPDEASLRRVTLTARAIGYSTGPSGEQLQRLWTRWGVLDAVAPRLVQARPGVPVASLIAEGQVEIGFQQASELMDAPGVEMAGPLPATLGLTTTFAAAVGAAGRAPDQAAAFIAFLRSPEAATAVRRNGMEPP